MHRGATAARPAPGRLGAVRQQAWAGRSDPAGLNDNNYPFSSGRTPG